MALPAGIRAGTGRRSCLAFYKPAEEVLSGHLSPPALLPIVLFLFSVGLSLAWYRAVSGEMQMLKAFGGEYISDVPNGTFYAAVGLGSLLALLTYFSDRVLVYCAVYAFYKLFEAWALWLRDKNIRDGLRRARSESAKDDQRRPGWDIIEHYYLERPQIPLAITEMGLSVAALVVAIYGELLPEPPLTTWLTAGAYGLILLEIALNLGVYTRWRVVRDRALGGRYW